MEQINHDSMDSFLVTDIHTFIEFNVYVAVIWLRQVENPIMTFPITELLIDGKPKLYVHKGWIKERSDF